MTVKLLWCCARGTGWKSHSGTCWNLLPSGVPGEASDRGWYSSEFAVNQPQGMPAELPAAKCCLAALNCRARSYRSYQVTGCIRARKEKAPAFSSISTGKAFHWQSVTLVQLAEKETTQLRELSLIIQAQFKKHNRIYGNAHLPVSGPDFEELAVSRYCLWNLVIILWKPNHRERLHVDMFQSKV